MSKVLSPKYFPNPRSTPLFVTIRDTNKQGPETESTMKTRWGYISSKTCCILPRFSFWKLLSSCVSFHVMNSYRWKYFRLSHRELHQLVMRMSPLGNGHVSEEDFHHLVCIPPRDVGVLLKIVERDILPSLIEAYRWVGLTALHH